jgi:hypothetical protein
VAQAGAHRYTLRVLARIFRSQMLPHTLGLATDEAGSALPSSLGPWICEGMVFVPTHGRDDSADIIRAALAQNQFCYVPEAFAQKHAAMPLPISASDTQERLQEGDNDNDEYEDEDE